MDVWPANPEMQHILAFGAQLVLNEAASLALNLHPAPCFVLDVLHVLALGAHDLSPHIKPRNRLEVNVNTLFGPAFTSVVIVPLQTTLVDETLHWALDDRHHTTRRRVESLFSSSLDVHLQRRLAFCRELLVRIVAAANMKLCAGVIRDILLRCRAREKVPVFDVVYIDDLAEKAVFVDRLAFSQGRERRWDR
jgi:hypothetical protein